MSSAKANEPNKLKDKAKQERRKNEDVIATDEVQMVVL